MGKGSSAVNNGNSTSASGAGEGEMTPEKLFEAQEKAKRQGWMVTMMTTKFEAEMQIIKKAGDSTSWLR